MSLLDLSSFLAADSEVAPDVGFAVVDRVGEAAEGEVAAHRLLLAGASPVFRKMFFVAETQDRRAAVIVVRDSSKAAFQAMVAAIYSKQPKAADLATLVLGDVFELANLAGRYEVLPLEPIVLEHLDTLPIPAAEEELMGMAETALAFSHLEAASGTLLLRCATSLRAAIKTVADLLQFAKRHQGTEREAVAMALQARMAEVPAPVEAARRVPRSVRMRMVHPAPGVGAAPNLGALHMVAPGAPAFANQAGAPVGLNAMANNIANNPNIDEEPAPGGYLINAEDLALMGGPNNLFA